MANIDSVKLPNGNEYNLQDVVTPRSFTNPNLAFNPWFTVNQRGVTSGSFPNGVYLMDRWKADTAGGTFSLTSSGFSFATSSSGPRYLQQWYEGTPFANDTYTISIMFPDGHIESATGIPQDIYHTPVSTTAYNGINLSLHDEVAIIRCAAGSTGTVKAVKIEKGTTSTIHLDTAPDYTTELLKCQRYYYRITASANSAFWGNGIVYNASQFLMTIANPVPFRTTPTMTYSGQIKVRDGNGNDVSVSSVAISYRVPNAIYFALNLASSLTTGLACVVFFTSQGDYIEFDAEL